MNEERTFQQKHKMLWPQNDNYYEYCKGGKTGYTDQARTTLVTMADNGDMQLVAVVLYDFGNDAYIDTRAMFDYAYSNFSKISLKDQKLPEGVKSYEDEDAYIVLPKSAQFSDVKAEVKEDSNKDGSGTVTFTYKGQEVGSVKAAIEKTEESSAAVLEKKKDNCDRSCNCSCDFIDHHCCTCELPEADKTSQKKKRKKKKCKEW